MKTKHVKQLQQARQLIESVKMEIITTINKSVPIAGAGAASQINLRHIVQRLVDADISLADVLLTDLRGTPINTAVQTPQEQTV